MKTTIAGGLVFALWLAAIAGWFLNIIRIFAAWDDPMTGMLIGRLLGVLFAPLGAVLGWIPS